jgi:NADH:ubiquinone oxidoreductase subunit
MQPLFTSFFTFIALFFTLAKTSTLPPSYQGFIHRLTHNPFLSTPKAKRNNRDLNTKKHRYASHNGVLISFKRVGA